VAEVCLLITYSPSHFSAISSFYLPANFSVLRGRGLPTYYPPVHFSVTSGLGLPPYYPPAHFSIFYLAEVCHYTPAHYSVITG
jgi:hypothetical protein